MIHGDPITETAKATQEVAKTTSKIIDFISRFIGGPIEQGMSIFEDKLKYIRWERKIRLMKRAEQFMLEQGIPKPTKAIPIKLILPLLQAASLEEDDYLQDLWAKLLVNGANANSGIDLTKAFIEILESLTPLEAKILEIIYSLPFKITQHKGIITGELPHQASPAPDDPRQNLKEPTDEVMLALGNLARHRCISFPASYGGGEVITTVNPTFLGKKFVEACSLQKVDPSKNS